METAEKNIRQSLDLSGAGTLRMVIELQVNDFLFCEEFLSFMGRGLGCRTLMFLECVHQTMSKNIFLSPYHVDFF